jgi:hypothetical protein
VICNTVAPVRFAITTASHRARPLVGKGQVAVSLAAVRDFFRRSNGQFCELKTARGDGQNDSQAGCHGSVNLFLRDDGIMAGDMKSSLAMFGWTRGLIQKTPDDEKYGIREVEDFEQRFTERRMGFHGAIILIFRTVAFPAISRVNAGYIATGAAKKMDVNLNAQSANPGFRGWNVRFTRVDPLERQSPGRAKLSHGAQYFPQRPMISCGPRSLLVSVGRNFAGTAARR